MRINRLIVPMLAFALALAAIGPSSMAVAAVDPPDQGCSPAFWSRSANLDQWNKFKPSDKFKNVFKRDDFGNKSLLKVIRQGGTIKKNAGRHAVAALLNASHKSIYFRFALAGEVHTYPFEVIKFWRMWKFRTFLRYAKAANRGDCPLS